MKITYSLTNDDFLTYQLYTISKSELHNRKRYRSRYFIPLLYVAFSLFLYYQKKNLTTSLTFIGIAVLWMLFYPVYSKWSYQNQLKKHISKNYQNRIDTPITLEIVNGKVIAKDPTAESNVDASEIASLIELPKHFLIQLTTNTAFIVPKQAVENPDLLQQEMIAIGATYINELDWEWR